MEANTVAARVVSTGTSFINGKLFTMTANATGSMRNGTIETSWVLGELPEGFSLLNLVDCTSAGVSPIFAIEINGGKNMLSLSGGNYRLSRTFDHGPYGSYEMRYEIRTSGEEVTSSGVQEGNLQLPPLDSAETSLVEYLIPAGPRTIKAYMRTTKTTDGGEQIPVFILGAYSPLDGDDDWALEAQPQVRHSHVDITGGDEGNELSLKYTTVISPIEIPELRAR